MAVAEELHFGRAAARLHVAQPAVSQTVKGVERELGVTLFDRTNRRVVLTHAGEVLLAEARAVLERLDSALEAMARLRAGDAGHVTIGAVPALPPQLVPRVLAHLAAELPSVTVVVRALGPGVRPADGLEGGFDLVLVRGQVGSPGLSTAVVAREPIGVALPTDHPLAVEAEVAPADLSGQALVSFPRAHQPNEYDRLFGSLAGAGFRGAAVVHESAPGAVDASL